MLAFRGILLRRLEREIGSLGALVGLCILAVAARRGRLRSWRSVADSTASSPGPRVFRGER